MSRLENLEEIKPKFEGPSNPGWLGWAMALGSFQCRGILLLLQIVGQGPAVFAAGAGRVGYIYFSFFRFFISLPFLMSSLLGDG